MSSIVQICEKQTYGDTPSSADVAQKCMGEYDRFLKKMMRPRVSSSTFRLSVLGSGKPDLVAVVKDADEALIVEALLNRHIAHKQTHAPESPHYRCTIQYPVNKWH